MYIYICLYMYIYTHVYIPIDTVRLSIVQYVCVYI